MGDSEVRLSTSQPLSATPSARVPSSLVTSWAFGFISALAETAGIGSPSRISPTAPASAYDLGREIEQATMSSSERLLACRGSHAAPTIASGILGQRSTGMSNTQRKQHHRRWSSQGAAAVTQLSKALPLPGRASDRFTEWSPEPIEASGLGLSRKHVEMATKLAQDALEEEDKDGDKEFALDCYVSSIDYLLSASSSARIPELALVTPARRAALRSKLYKLLDRIAESPSPIQSPRHRLFPSLDQSKDRTSSGTSSCALGGAWWPANIPRLGRRPTPAPASPPSAGPSEMVTGVVQPPADLVAACICGRKVVVRVPQWVLDSAIASAPCQCLSHTRLDPSLPRTWSEAFIAFVVECAVLFKSSPIPALIAALFSALLHTMTALNARFNLRKRAVVALVDGLEAMVELDKALGLHSAVGDVLIVAWEASVRAAAALAKSDEYRSPSIQVAEHKRVADLENYKAPQTSDGGHDGKQKPEGSDIASSSSKKGGYTFGRRPRAYGPAGSHASPSASVAGHGRSVSTSALPNIPSLSPVAPLAIYTAPESPGGVTPAPRRPSVDTASEASHSSTSVASPSPSAPDNNRLACVKSSSRPPVREPPPSYAHTVSPHPFTFTQQSCGHPSDATAGPELERSPSGMGRWARTAAESMVERLGYKQHAAENSP